MNVSNMTLIYTARSDEEFAFIKVLLKDNHIEASFPGQKTENFDILAKSEYPPFAVMTTPEDADRAKNLILERLIRRQKGAPRSRLRVVIWFLMLWTIGALLGAVLFHFYHIWRGS